MTRQILAAVAVLALVGGGVYYLLSDHETLGCDLCGRHLHEESSYQDSSEQRRGSGSILPRCGIRYEKGTSDVVGSEVAIYPSGEFIFTSEAFYVVRSNIHICAHDRTQRNRAGDIYHLLWDQRIPSLLASTIEEEAESFRRQHGGEILTYAEALASNL